MSMRPLHPARPGTRHGGFALITTLLILVMLTLLAVSMFRGFGLQQKIAGTTREKERAFQAAQNALQYGEWWIQTYTPGTGIVCSSQVPVKSITDMRTCSNPMTQTLAANPDGWTGNLIYTPPSMAVTGAAAPAPDGSKLDVTYMQPPEVYIAYLGMSSDGKQALYSVTAAGYGATADTRAVVQSVYGRTTTYNDVSQP